MSELILGFLKRNGDDRDIHKLSGYTMIETQSGPGFVGWGHKPYKPTYPLDKVSLALGQVAKQNKYGDVRITLASSLPNVWLSSRDNTILSVALRSVRAAVTVNARLRPDESPDYRHQAFVIFLMELNDESSAQSLLILSKEKQSRSNDFGIVGVKEDRLFCLAVGRSVTIGIAPFESQDSMRRFSMPIAAALKTLP